MKLAKKIISLLLCAGLVLPLCACSSDEPVQKQIYAMDTVMTLTAYGKYANDGISAAVGVINAMDDMLDPDNEGSYTAQINNAEGKDVIVTPQVNEMLSTALSVYNLSGGALDLSVYPLYEAWGEFKDETGRIPSDDEIKELRQKLGFGKTEITNFEGEANYSVRMPSGTQISFGAVAKGCASKYAIDAMRKSGVTSGIVSSAETCRPSERSPTARTGRSPSRIRTTRAATSERSPSAKRPLSPAAAISAISPAPTA